jgi:hypothetical protein
MKTAITAPKKRNNLAVVSLMGGIISTFLWMFCASCLYVPEISSRIDMETGVGKYIVMATVVISWFIGPLVSVISIILGLISLFQLRKSKLKGLVMALTGSFIGGISLLIFWKLFVEVYDRLSY